MCCFLRVSERRGALCAGAEAGHAPSLLCRAFSSLSCLIPKESSLLGSSLKRAGKDEPTRTGGLVSRLRHTSETGYLVFRKPS